MRAIYVIALLIFSHLALSTAAIADDEDDFNKAIDRQYESNRDQLRSMMMNAERVLDEEVKKKVAKGVIAQPTPEKRSQALEFAKTFNYNKAINQMRCAYEMRKYRPLEGTELEKEFQSCTNRLQGEMIKYSKLSDYASSFDPKKMMACEIKARDFEMERRFPPFEFLKTRDGPPAFNFKVLNDCLISSL